MALAGNQPCICSAICCAAYLVTGLPICPKHPSPANLPGPYVRLGVPVSHQIVSTCLVGMGTGARQVGSKVQVAEKRAVLNPGGCDHLG